MGFQTADKFDLRKSIPNSNFQRLEKIRVSSGYVWRCVENMSSATEPMLCYHEN